MLHVIDVGIGARPDTTLELHRALAARRAVRTTGLDLDPDRVAALQAAREPGVHAVLGGFDAELPAAHAVRAANLLRQYRLDAVPDALRALGRWLLPGGLLVEGSTDRHGGRGVFRVFRRAPQGLVPHALLAVSDPGAAGFAPRALTPYLPRGLGWHGHPGPAVAPLFQAWNRAFEQARAQGAATPAGLFVASARGLVRAGLIRDDPAGHAAGRVEFLADGLDLHGTATG